MENEYSPDGARPSGDWMLTFTGKQVVPMHISDADVDIRDIAHALSMACRFGGHVSKFYCPTPDQRVLTADLRWEPAGDLRVGDVLLGFDETPHEVGQAGKNRRRFRPSVVTHAAPVVRHVWRLEMEDGSTVKSSSEHPWLVATKMSRNQKWVTTQELVEALSDGRARYMHKFSNTWEPDRSWEAGWLSGIYDGEGYISLTDRGGVMMGVAQKEGLVYDAIRQRLADRGFKSSMHHNGDKKSKVWTFQTRGGWREMMRLLGTLRPVRLLDKFERHVLSGSFDKQMNGVGTPLKIVACYDEGEQEVAGLETSTHTYLCEGFGAHNSVAEHSVRVASILPPYLQLWGLLHDATEAYLGDMVRPLKYSMPEYRKVEAECMQVIARRFGLSWPEPPEVKVADNILLATERRDLMPQGGPIWRVEELHDALDYKIEPWPWDRAEMLFLETYDIIVRGNRGIGAHVQWVKDRNMEIA